MAGRVAITRGVPKSIERCLLTHLERSPIDHVRAVSQHADYKQALSELGCRVESLPAHEEFPDSVFVEDTAVITPDFCILTRPGAPTRRQEIDEVSPILKQHRPVHSLETPATLDGGDVLCIGRTLYVGVSTRTNLEAITQLARITRQYEYRVESLPVQKSLHLKTAVTQVGDEIVLLNEEWVDPAVFAKYKLITTDPRESFGANALKIGNQVLYPQRYERTAERLMAAGISLHRIDLSELEKAEAGLTCCSLVFAV